MLKHFVRLAIGGRSGKREQAWFVFLLWCAAFGWSAYQESMGAVMDGTQSILSLAFPMVMANLALAHGMEWVSAQTEWGGPSG